MKTRELVSVMPAGRGYRVEFTVNGLPRQTVQKGRAVIAFNFVRVVGRAGLDQLLRRKQAALEVETQSAEVEELEWLLAQLPAAEGEADA